MLVYPALNRADCAATRKSQHRVKSIPAPTAVPLIAAMVGLSRLYRRLIMAWAVSVQP
ncbi:hypothetical protein D3C87_1642820 [compost metagenome]